MSINLQSGNSTNGIQSFVRVRKLGTNKKEEVVLKISNTTNSHADLEASLQDYIRNPLLSLPKLHSGIITPSTTSHTPSIPII
jgi:hypothetical protein